MRRSDLELLAELVAEPLVAALGLGVPPRRLTRDPFAPDPENPGDAVESLSIRTMYAQDVIDGQCGEHLYRRLPPAGYVYAIRSWRGGPTKIGKAVDPVERLISLQSGSPEPFVLVGLCHDATLERRLHTRYRDRRVYMEMFDLGDENPIPREFGRCMGCRR